MAYVGDEEASMRPKVGDTRVTLPVTFDYTGGRVESFKYKVLWSVAIGIVGIIACIGIIFNKRGSWYVNIPLGFAVLYAVLWFIRYIMLNESKVRKYYAALEATDYEKDFRDYWGIYAVEETYPYVVRYRNGRSGLFIRLNKDVILGKYSESEYEHYEAIGDAYNIAGTSSITMCHVDYMANVGSDERIEEAFIDLGNVDNTDLRDVLIDIFGYMQHQMNERVTTYDVYVFTYSGSDVAAWNSIQRILSCFMDANYVNYQVLDISEIRELFKTLINVHEFSANTAMSNAFEFDNVSAGVVPIRIIYDDGTEEKLNKTQAELKSEAQVREQEKTLKENERKRRKEEAKKAKQSEKIKKPSKKTGKGSNKGTSEGNENSDDDDDWENKRFDIYS
jgi:hypothetical protein